MKLFEFEAKRILKQYHILVPKGDIARNPDEAMAIAEEIGGPVVLKSQILVSGRGKSGGIIFADTANAAKKVASSLIGSAISGRVVNSLLVEEKLDIVEEFYTSVAIDRQARKYIVLASLGGGTDIEEVAQTFPDKISRHWVNPGVGFARQDAAKMVSRFNMSKDDAARFASIIDTLYKIVMEYDAELVEINPLVRIPAGELVAADARIIVDDNAVFRHAEFKDRSLIRVDDTPKEAEARQHNLAYVDLSGDIGIIGNGAGLVMATLDLVHLFGGRPANFLDIGGSAQTEIIKRGVMLVMLKPEVKAVLVNILGGITRCDRVAQGIVEALDESAVKKPIAVRMIGTNEEEGTQILHRAGVHTYSNMEEAVQEILKL